MTKPVLKILAGPSPAKAAFSQVAAMGMGSVGSVLSKAADSVPHDPDGLLQILYYRNHIARQAGRRSRWIGGRIYNHISGEYPDYIPISGTHLRQTLSVVGIETPDIVAATGQYQLRLDVSEKAVKLLLEMRG
jgi:hypothetical protein